MELESEIVLEDTAAVTASTLASIGSRIREARISKGRTLQALADLTRLSPSMLSLVERGRASPSIGSLIVIANALGITMSDLVADAGDGEDKLVVRAEDAQAVATGERVVRRLLREDLVRGVSVAINEYEPGTGSSEQALSHQGYEYGFVLEGELTVEVEGQTQVLQPGDLVSYSSRRPHKMWNHSNRKVRTLWVNLKRD